MAEMNALSRWVVNHLKARANARLYEWVAAHTALPPAAVCLEVGCGNGNMAARLVDGMDVGRLVATDVDPRQLEAAAEYLGRRFPGALPAGLELRPADMLRLPFPDAGFDAVFAFSTLHHAGEGHRDASRLGEALTEIDRVLKPGGLLVYEEFLHKELLRRWLSEHRFQAVAVARRWRRELAVVRKPVPVAAWLGG